MCNKEMWAQGYKAGRYEINAINLYEKCTCAWIDWRVGYECGLADKENGHDD